MKHLEPCETMYVCGSYSPEVTGYMLVASSVVLNITVTAYLLLLYKLYNLYTPMDLSTLTPEEAYGRGYKDGYIEGLFSQKIAV